MVVELRIRQFHAHNGDESFAQIVARWHEILEEVVLARVAVHNARECSLESLHVCAAVAIRDVVAEREREFLARIDILHREIKAQRLFSLIGRERNHRALRGFLLVPPCDVAADSIGAIERSFTSLTARVDAFVDQSNAHAWVQVREFTQTTF